MGDQESQKMTCKVSVSLPYDTPVVGCEINPIVRFQELKAQASIEVPPYSLSFTWYREQIFCSVHDSELATVQCMSCVNLKIPAKDTYHCSTNCFLGGWKKHLERHQLAAKTFCEPRDDDQQAMRKLRSCGSWPDFGNNSLFDEGSTEKEWVKVGSSKSYIPSIDDASFTLRLVCVTIDRLTGMHLSPENVLVTHPVITFPARCPRSMIQTRSLRNTLTVNPKLQPCDDVTFSVLSYNILSDMYATRDMYSYCPTWALAWEYRRQNLLQEINEYDADILCLQEVQSDHFENFFKPELNKRGYAAMYKKKTQEVYTANQYIIDGCATFYRCDMFKEIKKYELEFDKKASLLVEALDPGLRVGGKFHLAKANIALVVVLEVLKTGRTNEGLQSRICVANTHIYANSNSPDVKLFQVSVLVHELEKIAGLKVPLLICGDMNSLPESDPYKFLVGGNIDPSHQTKQTDPFGIYRLLNLQHWLSLKSAYASLFIFEGVEEPQLRKMDYNSHQPLFTCFTPRFSGTLDYILYTDRSLKVEGLLELLDPESMAAGLPSPLWSSDHIALMASFRFISPHSYFPTPTRKLYSSLLSSNPCKNKQHPAWWKDAV